MADKFMRRVICHWTAGAGRASDLDLAHYHRLVEYDGKIVHGKEAIEDNIVTSDGDYAAHTLRLNTGSIGVALCGMRGAKEQPFHPGPSPITELQFEAGCKLIADLCVEYGIPVGRKTVLFHAEVEPTLGVKQRGKWDIARLPFKPEIRGAIPVGDYMRARVKMYLGDTPLVLTDRATVRFGMKGASVAELQSDLAALGYFAGRVDGDFGPLTRAAVLAFQADNDLATDAIVGPRTWTAMSKAEARPPRDITMDEIEEESGIAQDALMAARVGDLLGAGGVVGVATQATEAAQAASGFLGTATSMVTQHWPALIACGGCFIAWLALRAISRATRERRLRDAREHRSLAR